MIVADMTITEMKESKQIHLEEYCRKILEQKRLLFSINQMMKEYQILEKEINEYERDIDLIDEQIKIKG